MTAPGIKAETTQLVLDALAHVVLAAGGYRRVGYAFWPHLGVKRAGTRMRRCLDPRSREKLALAEYLELLRRGRRLGIDTPMEILADDAGYDAPRPCAPESAPRVGSEG